MCWATFTPGHTHILFCTITPYHPCGEEWHFFCVLKPSLHCSCISQLSPGYAVVTNIPNISMSYDNKCLFFTLVHASCKLMFSFILGARMKKHPLIESYGRRKGTMWWLLKLLLGSGVWHVANAHTLLAKKSFGQSLCQWSERLYPCRGRGEWIIGNNHSLCKFTTRVEPHVPFEWQPTSKPSNWHQ